MMIKLKLLLVSVALLIMLPDYVASQEVVSLQEAIHEGLKQNFSLQVARNNETISENNVTPGNAGYLPSVSLRGQQSGTLNNTYQNLNDGSEVSATGIHNATSSASINLGWTIFDGFRVQTTYQRLESFEQLGELNTRMAVENLVANIAAEYFNYIQQNNLLNNLKYSMDLSRERMRIDEERYLIGSGSRLQLLQSEVFMNADSSRLSRQYEVVRASRIRLNELMAVEDVNRMFSVADTSIVVNPSLLLDNLIQASLKGNTSLLIASRNQIISEFDRKILASASYPYITFNSGYGVSHNVFGASSIRNQQTLGANYGVTIGIDLFDGWNQRRRLNNADIEIENRQLRFREVETGLMADLHTIYNGYQNNLRLLQMENHNLEVAQETLEIAIERYRLGALSGLELREAQQSLLEAEERLLSIQYQAKIAEISLLQIAGKITEYL
ncbi:MAG: TolC family protein [Bacteroidales bacterium]